MAPWTSTRATELLKRHRHMCAFFNSADEEYRVTLPFMREGLMRGERILNILRDRDRPEHGRRMRGGGIDVEASLLSGQMEIQRAHDVYLPDGKFDKEGMLAFVRRTLDDSAASPYPAMRVVAHCECVLQDRRSAADFLEYEARLNHLLPQYPDQAICVFDSQQVGAEVALDIFRTHPVVILGGMVRENPFYEAPDTFLKELAQRYA